MNINIIKIRMIEKELNNKNLASMLSINENTISRWINGKNLIQIENFLKMLEYLNISINEIMS